MIKKSKPFENLAYLAHSVIMELSDLERGIYDIFKKGFPF